MSKTFRVFKFGGASVKNATAMRNVASIIHRFKNDNLVIVTSAMGKTTNALEKVVHLFFENQSKARTELKGIKDIHLTTLSELSLSDESEAAGTLNDLFSSVDNFIRTSTSKNYDLVYDQIVSVGELASTSLLVALLKDQGINAEWIDARDIVLTDSTYREARVDWTKTHSAANDVVREVMMKADMIVTQGFLGRSDSGFTTTLGREGSDYSGAILAHALDAVDMSIWKDVPGILTGDPKLFEHVQKIDHLSYREAIEMTYYGAKVIHPKTIKPLQNKGIPLKVKAFDRPDAEGTVIGGEVVTSYPPVVVVEKDQVMLHIRTRDFSFVAEEHLAELFKVFAKFRFKVNLMRNTAISFSVCLSNKPRKLDALVATLEENYNVFLDSNLELITIRHYTTEVVEELKKNKLVVLEERIPQTIQLVVKNAPRMTRK